jgi:hypothetical protein
LLVVSDHGQAHPFTGVDAQSDPARWIRVLDALRREPAYAAYKVTNGVLAHQMGRLFVRAGLTDIRTEATPIVLRDPCALDNAMGLRSWAATACARGFLDGAEVHRWEQMLDEAETQGYFLYAFTVYATAGIKR